MRKRRTLGGASGRRRDVGQGGFCHRGRRLSCALPSLRFEERVVDE